MPKRNQRTLDVCKAGLASKSLSFKSSWTSFLMKPIWWIYQISAAPFCPFMLACYKEWVNVWYKLVIGQIGFLWSIQTVNDQDFPLLSLRFVNGEKTWTPTLQAQCQSQTQRSQQRLTQKLTTVYNGVVKMFFCFFFNQSVHLLLCWFTKLTEVRHPAALYIGVGTGAHFCLLTAFFCGHADVLVIALWSRK